MSASSRPEKSVLSRLKKPESDWSAKVPDLLSDDKKAELRAQHEQKTQFSYSPLDGLPVLDPLSQTKKLLYQESEALLLDLVSETKDCMARNILNNNKITNNQIEIYPGYMVTLAGELINLIKRSRSTPANRDELSAIEEQAITALSKEEILKRDKLINSLVTEQLKKRWGDMRKKLKNKFANNGKEQKKVAVENQMTRLPHWDATGKLPELETVEAKLNEFEHEIGKAYDYLNSKSKGKTIATSLSTAKMMEILPPQHNYLTRFRNKKVESPIPGTPTAGSNRSANKRVSPIVVSDSDPDISTPKNKKFRASPSSSPVAESKQASAYPPGSFYIASSVRVVFYDKAYIPAGFYLPDSPLLDYPGVKLWAGYKCAVVLPYPVEGFTLAIPNPTRGSELVCQPSPIAIHKDFPMMDGYREAPPPDVNYECKPRMSGAPLVLPETTTPLGGYYRPSTVLEAYPGITLPANHYVSLPKPREGFTLAVRDNQPPAGLSYYGVVHPIEIPKGCLLPEGYHYVSQPEDCVELTLDVSPSMRR